MQISLFVYTAEDFALFTEAIWKTLIFKQKHKLNPRKNLYVLKIYMIWLFLKNKKNNYPIVVFIPS